MSEAQKEPVVQQEDDRIPARPVATVILTGLFLTLAGIGAAGWMLHVWHGPFSAGVPLREFRGGVAPREIGIVDQTPIRGDHFGQRLRASQEQTLSRYAWVDRSRGVVRIPIERAMDIVAQRGVGTPGTASQPQAPAVMDLRAPTQFDAGGGR